MPLRSGPKPGWPSCLWVVFLVLACLAQAQEAPEDKTGLAVGAKAPEFTLRGQDGKEHSLKTLLEAGTVALVFHRSADW